MKSDTYSQTRHSKFRYTCLQEGSSEVVSGDGSCLFQEAVGLVGVRQVGTAYYHISQLYGEFAEYCGRCGTRCLIGLLGYLRPIDLGRFVREELAEFLCQDGILLLPFANGFAFFSYNIGKLGFAAGIYVFCLFEQYKRIVYVATEIFYGICVSIATESCTVCLAAVLVRGVVGTSCSFTHNGISDDKCRFVCFGFCLTESHAYLLGVVAVYLYYAPAPSLILLTYVFGAYIRYFCRELYVVRVVEHYQVA